MLRKWLCVLALALGLGGAGPSLAVENGAFYIVTHRDFRKCAAPLCGGFYVKEVNKALSRCADGKARPECYVGGIEYPGFEAPPKGRKEFAEEFAAGFGLAQGALRNRPSPFGPVGALAVRDAWRAQALKLPAGDFYRVTDAGIRCITQPCFSLREEFLNSRRSMNISGLDLKASGARPSRVREGLKRLYIDGILVAGRHVRTAGPAGSGRTLVASEFYLREPARVPAPSGGQRCGANPGRQCPTRQRCDPGTLGCAADGLEGTCQVKPEVCTLDYHPVCGCNGVTYGNDCQRRGAGVGLAHPGECQGGNPPPMP